MTRGTLLRPFVGLAGVLLIGTALAACASPKTDAARPPLTVGPSTATITPTVGTTPSRPKPRPRPPARHLAPSTAAPHSAPPPAPPKPVPTRPASPRTSSPAAPPRTTEPAPPPKPSNCDPAYPGVCLEDGIGDYDCAGGSGNGPHYVNGPITVRAPDPFGLDADHDGIGCE